MAYRFQLDEPFAKGFVRIGLEQIERAARRLRSAEEGSVHDARKGLKRIRALLRLGRPGIGEAAFRRENARFRDIAALLAGTRDRQVLAETLTKLEHRFGEASSALQEVRGLFASAPEASEPQQSDRSKKKAVAALHEAASHFKRLRLQGPGFEPIGAGLEACYGKGRRMFAAAYDNPSDEAFHEWRKTVQQHWRQMTLLSQAWPEFMEARVAEAKRLSELLGDDHDLAMLEALLRAGGSQALRKSLAREIERLCRRRQKELREAAQPHGRRLFAEGAKGLRRRVALYWETAARIGAQEKERSPPEPEPDPAPSAAPSAAPRLPVRRNAAASKA